MNTSSATNKWLKLGAWAFAMTSVSVSIAGEAIPKFYRIDEKIPDAKESIYSNRLSAIVQNWPPKDLPSFKTSPIWLRGIRTPQNSTYIGMEKSVLIAAPLSRVLLLLDDYENYKDRASGLVVSKIVERDWNRTTVHWEFRSPVFFAPNSQYDEVFVADRTRIDRGRAAYRYQLKSANNLNYADGVIVVESLGKSTRLTSFDFFDAQWGILGGVAGGKIWQDSLEGYYKGDLALKIQAEHPDWKIEQIDKEVEKMFKQFPLEKVEYLEKL